MGKVVALVVLGLAIAHLTTEQVEGLGCSDIGPAVAQFTPFALGQVHQPSNRCCNELKRVNGMGQTTGNQRALCKCLKQYAPQFPNIKDGLLASLPKRCGVSVSFIFSRKTNCDM